MKVVENQKIVIVNKEASDKEHPYSIINLAAAENAGMTLNGNEFKLWFYIAKNQNGYSFALSKANFCKQMNVSASTYHRAIDTLISKGYLVAEENNKNTYRFFEFCKRPIEKESFSAGIPKSKNKKDKKSSKKEKGFFIYKYVNEKNNIVYIGKTSRPIEERIFEHKKDKLQNFVGSIYYFNCKTARQMDILEYILINKYHPLFNEKDNDKKINININEPQWIFYMQIQQIN